MRERSDMSDDQECGDTLSVFVGSKQELVEKAKKRCDVNGRDIVIFYHNRNFYAMDQRCYRKLITVNLRHA